MNIGNNKKKLKAKYGKIEAIIEEDLPHVGFYLFIYEYGKGICDYLQDSVEICKEQSFEEFGVPSDSWEEVIE